MQTANSQLSTQVSTPLNCLQCRHCALLPQTDFTQKSPVIHCGQLQNTRLANFEGCPSAAPIQFGSRRQGWSDTSNAFLRTHYPLASYDFLITRLRRSLGSIRSQAYDLKVQRDVRELARRGPRKLTWTTAQEKYLATIYGTDEWPLTGASNRKKGQREVIMTQVAAQGPAHSWMAIKLRAAATTPMGQRRAHRRRLARQKKVKVS